MVSSGYATKVQRPLEPAGKKDIPMVRDQLSLIQEVRQKVDGCQPLDDRLCKDSPARLSGVIDRQAQSVVYTDFEDELGEVQEVAGTALIMRALVLAIVEGRAPFRNRASIVMWQTGAMLRPKPISGVNRRNAFRRGRSESRDRFEAVFGERPKPKALYP